uniref:SWI5 recombination repair homolog (yeast) n=1 Tax=Mus musculus TaxID=10090 RepID=A2AN40_MOUSE
MDPSEFKPTPLRVPRTLGFRRGESEFSRLYHGGYRSPGLPCD